MYAIKHNMPTLVKMKEFCKLIEIPCSGNKPDVQKRIYDYLKNYKYAPRYLRGLTKEEKFEKMFEIKYNSIVEKKTGKKNYKQVKTDYISPKKSVRKSVGKVSKYTEKWNKTYKDAKDLPSKSKISGVPLPILKKVYNKGLEAWRGGQHRPGATQQQWGVSRVNSFLTCGKTFYFPDHLLAKEAIKKSPKAKKFWEKQGCKFSKMGTRTPSR